MTARERDLDASSEQALEWVGLGVMYAAALWRIPGRAHTDMELGRWGLWPFRDKRLAMMSLGERRRFMLAVSRVMDPIVWILESPSEGLDAIRGASRGIADGRGPDCGTLPATILASQPAHAGLAAAPYLTPQAVSRAPCSSLCAEGVRPRQRWRGNPKKRNELCDLHPFMASASYEFGKAGASRGSRRI